MNVLIISQSNFIKDHFVRALIPQGILLFHTETYSQVIDILLNHDIEIAIIDSIHGNFNIIFSLMSQIKSYPEEKVNKAAIILLVDAIDRDNISQALKSGAIGFIKSTDNENVIYNYIVKIYMKVKGTSPERKYARVTLDTDNPEERIGISFHSPISSQLIMGLIKDISFGGIAVELKESFTDDCLAVGMEVKNLQFIINNENILVNAFVVAFKYNLCAFRFAYVSEKDRDLIAHFIYEKTST